MPCGKNAQSQFSSGTAPVGMVINDLCQRVLIQVSIMTSTGNDDQLVQLM